MQNMAATQGSPEFGRVRPDRDAGLAGKRELARAVVEFLAGKGLPGVAVIPAAEPS